MARLTFADTFRHYREEDLRAYSEESLSETALAAELEGEKNLFYFVVLDGARVGYLKCIFPSDKYLAHVNLNCERPFLLERFYFLPEHGGRGLGSVAFAFVESLARHHSAADYLYLSVWDKNYRAQSFYQKHGFRTIGSFDYPVGEEIDHELLFGKRLT